MYFDDIIGNDVWLCNEFTGERLAIAEFNQKHKTKKIAKNYSAPNQYWSNQIYVYHDFDHPKYNNFVAGKEQIEHENRIELKIT